MKWKPTKLTRAQMAERRWEGGRLLRQREFSKAQIAHQLGVSRTAVSKWSRRMRTGGLRRLHQQVSGGRPARLTPTQQRALVRRLRQGALAADFPTDRWTLRRVQHLIKREFQVAYHPNYLGRLLRKLGCTPQYPMPRAKERDDELVEAWLRQDWPRVKKSASFGGRNRAV